MVDEEGTYFPLRRRVKQRDPLSPLLFNCALEEVFKNLNWLKRIQKLTGVVLIGSAKEELEEMV